MKTMDHRPMYSTNVRPAFAARQLADLNRLGEVLRQCGADKFADDWYDMLAEVEARIRDGWRDRSGNALDRIAVTLDVEPGAVEWTVHATMKPVLRAATRR